MKTTKRSEVLFCFVDVIKNFTLNPDDNPALIERIKFCCDHANKDLKFMLDGGSEDIELAEEFFGDNCLYLIKVHSKGHVASFEFKDSEDAFKVYKILLDFCNPKEEELL